MHCQKHALIHIIFLLRASTDIILIILRSFSDVCVHVLCIIYQRKNTTKLNATDLNLKSNPKNIN